eukprot:12897184-Prorocentrum_lima.AAC.1
MAPAMREPGSSSTKWKPRSHRKQEGPEETAVHLDAKGATPSGDHIEKWRPGQETLAVLRRK